MAEETFGARVQATILLLRQRLHSGSSRVSSSGPYKQKLETSGMTVVVFAGVGACVAGAPTFEI